MRLKSIKLAGFKSFVDPTTVTLPSNLCAVVGPNGCGKSNIIDAVRWVMGESSAKNLRGEHMTDVIFNGSRNRKPVGQASVELVFDNSDRTIKGEYASFNEISIRRLVNSESQSKYFLNGSKCRRKDITDIFLGTGLGPRSYSIIEQGMVSNLIESKPEELRVYIEEAAGISKYKERRRETENRIKRTKENLERLTDIREELERQLQHLQRQARAAERYKEHKQDERDTTAKLDALRWKALNTEVTSTHQLISELDIKLESSIADSRALEAEIEKQRFDGVESKEKYQEVQSAFYSLGSDISRIEQNIEHQRQRKVQLEEDLLSIQESLTSAQAELEQDLDKITSLDEESAILEPELESSRVKEESSNSAQESAEKSMTQWQLVWDHFNIESGNSTRNAEVEQQRINHLENIVERGSERKTSLNEQLSKLERGQESEEIEALDESIDILRETQNGQQDRNAQLNEQIESVRSNLKVFNNDLNQQRSRLQSLLGRQSSLDALQQAALGQKEGAVLNWLENNQLNSKPRLVDELKVEEEWQLALETVLGQHLQAVCVNDISSLGDVLDTFSEGQLTLADSITNNLAMSENTALQARRLSSKITSENRLPGLVDGVYCADDLSSALSLRSSLKNYESIITKQGIWLGSSWLRVSKSFDEKAGMIQRQEEISAIGTEITEVEVNIQALEGKIDYEQSQLQQLEFEKDEFLQQLSEINRQLTELSSDRSAKSMKIEQESEQRNRLQLELGELEKQLLIEQENISTSRVNLQSALDLMELDTSKREELLQSRDEYRRILDTSRQQARHDKDHTHQLALKHQTMLAQLNSLKSTLDRISAQVKSYELRQTQLQTNLKDIDDPLPGLKDELESNLSRRVDIQSQLTEATTRVDGIDHAIRELEFKRNETQDNTQKVRDQLVNKRLGIEGATVKRGALEERITEASYNLETLINLLDEELSESDYEQSLEKIANRIQRLGPINLAAIDEYSTQSERKVYLDSQNDDIERALVTLENAIRKIDKETRTRFKETFDKINTSLQELFPKVFGGGHAYLDMTGDDLLDTGVTIMARPPGKRNSTIHLLSGGEKAMTAIALVFSIFRLNPSPFCMLDEVDAPLDDANTSRYIELVKEMSDLVQFIFITHNRITMEVANQLLGVTMHEPGVSRMVAVDIEKAAEMAAM